MRINIWQFGTFSYSETAVGEKMATYWRTYVFYREQITCQAQLRFIVKDEGEIVNSFTR